MTQYRNTPTFNESVTYKDRTATSWYRWFQDVDRGTPPRAESAVSLTGSPFTYMTIDHAGVVIVSGGTVSLIQFARTSGVNYNTGQTAGMFTLAAGDMLIITYAVAPTVTFVPQ